MRTLGRVLQFVATGLTLWLPGTVVATVLALLVAIWIWAGTADSLARLVSATRSLSPALTHLTWTGTGATVRQGGQLGNLSWQHDGLSVEMRDAFIGWEWLAQPPLQTPPAEPPAARVRITVKSSGVQASDQRPASQTPLSPPTNLTLPWPLNSWAAPVELVFDVGAITLAGQPALALRDVSGRHVYAPAQADWAHHLTLHATLRNQEAAPGHTGTPTQARYTLQAQAQADHPLAMQASLKGEVSGTLPGHTPPPGTPTPAWHGQLTANLAGQLAGPQATLHASASLTSRAAAGRPAPSARLEADIHPWASQPIGRLTSHMTSLDLAALWPDLPRTRLSGHANAHPTSPHTWGFDLGLANGASGPWDRQSLPVTQLTARGEWSNGTGQAHTTVKLEELLAQVGGGQVTAQGHWNNRSWQGALSATGIRADALHSALPNTVLQGTVRAAPDTTSSEADPGQAMTVVLTASPTNDKHSNEAIYLKRQSRFSSDFSWRQNELDVRSFQLNSHGGVLSAQGALNTGQLSLSGLAELTVPGLHVQAKGSLSSDQGGGKLAARLTQADALAQWLRQLPLWPSTWTPPTISGAAELDASWAGGWPHKLTVDAKVHAPQLTGTLPLNTSPGQATPPQTWSASGVTWTVAGSPARWQSELSGNLRWLQWSAGLATRATGAFGALAASGTPDLTRGEVTLQALQLFVAGAPTGAAVTPAGAAAPPAPLQATLAAATDVQWDAGGLRLAPGMLRLQANHHSAAPGGPTGASLTWSRSTWADAHIDASGDIAGINLDLARVLAGLAAPNTGNADPLAGWLGDLTLGGPWQVRWPGTPQAPARLSASLSRQTGDLQAPLSHADNEDNRSDNGTVHQALGIQSARLALTADAQHWNAEVDWASRAGGQARANVQLSHTTPATTAWPTADSHLSGQLSAQLPRAGVWSRLAPPGWRVTGSLALDAQLGGTLGQPTWQGTLSGRNLSARSAVEGLAYTQGELDATLSSNRVDITRLTLQGAGGPTRGGNLLMTGQATWSTADKAPRIRLNAHADKLNVSARADRRLTLSGTATATVAENTLTLRGQLRADQAQFTLPDEFAPTLGSDVVVRSNRSAQPPTRASGLRTDVAVDIDLGPAFDVRGQGLQTRLTGQLRVSSPPGSDAFGVTGEVRAASGTYRAYGQQLRIEEGVLRFSGPYDDPTLSILALRGTTNTPRSVFGNDDQQVGVKVTGSVRNPRMQLYASPELPDSEKLAWLVLGRPASGAGAEAAIMQQAAMALLGNQVRGLEGGLANGLGLDELGVSTSTGNNGTNQASAAVTLGKRLSSRLYVTYQHSLDSTAGALNLFYDVSRRLTVRAQMGSESAIDLIFTLPHD